MEAMNKMARRKGQILRRATAILLSLTMVFSVIYMNNRADKLLAEELNGAKAFEAFTDATYLAGRDFTATGKTITLHSPSEKISFTLPTVTMTDGYTYQWYAVGTEPAQDATDKWKIVDGTTLATLDKDNLKAVLYKTKAGKEAVVVADDPSTTDVDESLASEAEVPAEVEKLTELDLKIDNLIELDASSDDANHEIKISGTDVYENEDTEEALFYATTSFAYEKDATAAKSDAASVTGWTTRTSVSTALNQAAASADGKYFIYKKTELHNAANTLCYFFSVEVSRDYYMEITGATLSADGKTATASAGAVSIDKVKPVTDVVFTVDTTDDVTAIKAVNKNDSTDVITASGAKTLTFPGAEANDGVSLEYTITVTSGTKVAETYEATIGYLSAKPAVKDLKVTASWAERAPVSGTVYIGVNDNPVKVEATAEVPEGVTTDKAQLWEVISGTASKTSADDVTLNGSTDVKIDLPSGIEAGLHEYKVWVLTSGGISALSDDSVKVLYDSSKPTISGLQVKGMVGGTVTTQTAVDGKISEAVSPDDDISITLTAKDLTNGSAKESGVDEVSATVWGDTYKGTLVDAANGTYSITIPKRDAFRGQTITFDLSAKDVAGNVSDVSKLEVSFSSNYIQIKSEITGTTLNKDSATKDGTFRIDYTITMDEELRSGEISFNRDGSLDTKGLAAASFTEVNKKDADHPYYVYTYSLLVNETVSTVLETIKLKVTNSNWTTFEEKDGQTIIRIDLTSGNALVTSDKNQTWIDSDIWFRNPVIDFTFSEKTTVQDAASGTYQSGFPKKAEDAIKDLVGGTIESYTLNDPAAGPKGGGRTEAGMYGHVVISVTPSTDETGTDLSFTLCDVVGNEYKYSTNIKVDTVRATINDFMAKSGGHTVTEKTEEKSRYLGGDPTISFVTEDNIKVDKVEASIKKPGGATVDITSFLSADNNLDGETLSTLLGAAPEDGKYTVTVKAYDLVGTTNPEGNPTTATITFMLDATDPSASIELTDPSIIKNGKYTREKTVEVGFTVYDDGIANAWNLIKDSEKDLKAIFKVTDNGKVLAVSDWTLQNLDGSINGTVKISGEGNHTIKLHVEDFSNGKCDAAPLTFVIDTTKPQIFTTVNGKKYTESDSDFLDKAAEVTLGVSDKNKDKNGLSIMVQEEAYIGAGAATYLDPDPMEGTKTYSDDANYVITYTATDMAGNKATRQITFTVDKTRPVNDIKIREPQNAAKFATYKSSYENKASGVAYDYAQYFNHDVTVDLSVDDHFLDTATVIDTDASGRTIRELSLSQDKNTASYTATTEGAHNIVITSKDLAGNASVAKSVSFVIDRTNPTVSTTLNSDNFSEGDATRYLTSRALVGVSVSDANKDEADLTRIVRQTAPGGGTSVSDSKVSEGAQEFSTEADYVVSFKAVDRAGNESTERSVSFRVDMTPPELSITGATDGESSTKAITATYTVHEAFYSDMTEAQVRVYRKLDGEGRTLLRTVDFKGAGANASKTETFDEDGRYEFEFSAQDKAGNSASKTFSFLVDTTAPSLLLSGVKNYEMTKSNVDMETMVTEAFYSSNSLLIEGAREDIDGKQEKLKFEQPNVNTGREVKFVQHFVDDGIYDLNVKSKDKAGNESAEAVHFTIDKTPPVIGDLSKYDGVTLNKFVWDIDENALVRDLTVCDVTIYLDGTVYDGISNLTDGSHVLRVTAVDEVGNESSKEVSFLLDQIMPNIIITGIEDNKRIEEPVDISVSLQIADDILDSVTLNGDPQTISGNASSFKVEKAGDYKLVVKAHDAAGNESELNWSFTYGSKVNWLLIFGIAGGVLLLAIILLIIRKKSWSKKN